MKKILTTPLSDATFVVIDVETTGANPQDNRVMDIACVVVKNNAIVDSFSSLIRPGQSIPRFISQMTKITNAMVFNAPEAAEVFPSVLRYFQSPNTVFVGHNVGFDWSFVQASLLRLGMPALEVPNLCTIKLAKRLLPQIEKYGLDTVTKFFSVQIKSRHRAIGDAMATAEVFVALLHDAQRDHNITTLEDLLRLQNRPLPQHPTLTSAYDKLRQQVDSIPYEPGVYKFLNKKGEVLYVGKAKSLHERVSSYFGTNNSEQRRKIKELMRKVDSIEWECTGTELSALLRESVLIKQYSPKYNTLLKKYRRYPFLRLSTDQPWPRLSWAWEIQADGADYFGPFSSRSSVEDILDLIDRTFLLRKCSDDLRPSPSFVPCFYYQIKRCEAPCARRQSEQDYAEEVERVRNFLSGDNDGIIAVLQSRMNALAADERFEEATQLKARIRELEKVFFRQQRIATSVNSHNVAIILPVRRDNKAELFLVRHGRLEYQRTVGKRFPKKELTKAIDAVYGDGSMPPRHCKKEEIDQINILSSWIHRNRNVSKFVYYSPGMNTEAMLSAIESEVWGVLNGSLMQQS